MSDVRQYCVTKDEPFTRMDAEFFIARENLRRYRARLEAETTTATREILVKLIVDEEAKLEAIERERNEARQRSKPTRPSAGSLDTR